MLRGNMAKEHGPSGNRKSPAIYRVLFLALLVALAFVGYNFWESKNRVKVLEKEMESLKSTETENLKQLETCKDQLKLANDDNKKVREQLTQKEATIATQEKNEKDLQENVQKLAEELNNLKSKLEIAEKAAADEVTKCQTSKQEWEGQCNKDCDTKINAAKTQAEAACQSQVKQPVETKQLPAVNNPQL